MPFNPETAKAAGQKSKRGPSKLLGRNEGASLSLISYVTDRLGHDFPSGES